MRPGTQAEISLVVASSLGIGAGLSLLLHRPPLVTQFLSGGFVVAAVASISLACVAIWREQGEAQAPEGHALEDLTVVVVHAPVEREGTERGGAGS